jgi:hypothetical protein
MFTHGNCKESNGSGARECLLWCDSLTEREHEGSPELFAHLVMMMGMAIVVVIVIVVVETLCTTKLNRYTHTQAHTHTHTHTHLVISRP